MERVSISLVIEHRERDNGEGQRTLPSDDNSSRHLGRDDLSGEDSSSNGDLSSEGALFVDVGTVDSFLGSLRTENGCVSPSVSS